MKKNGFTLVELLAVIVILSILFTIVTVIVNPTVENSTKKLSKIQIQYIEEVANTYYLKEGVNNEYDGNSFEMCVDLSYLIENDYIENEEVLNPKDYEKLDGSVKITYKFDQISYKYQENNCTYKYQSIDNICSLENDVDPIGISIGDKYQCKVKDDMKEDFKDGYYFYLLSKNKDGTVNLIMDRNICEDGEPTNKNKEDNCTVAWYSDSMNNSDGPVTAMTYLHNATKDWTNVSNIIIDYEDENLVWEDLSKGTTGYGGIKTTGTTTKITNKNGQVTASMENLKARMPSFNELYGKEKCITQTQVCPLWLSSNLIYDKGVLGYWTLSSCVSESHTSIFSYHVFYTGYLTFSNVYTTGVGRYDDEIYGVRPVIKLSRNDLEIKVPI